MDQISKTEKFVWMQDLIPLIQEQLETGKNVKFSPRGVSMLPMLRQGIDSVVFSPVPGKLRKYDLPLYRRDNGQYVLHRIVKAGDTYTCIGDNQFVYEPGIRHDQLLAVVTAFTRRNREYGVNHFGYKIYCRVWHYTRPLRHLWRRGKSWLKRLIFR